MEMEKISYDNDYNEYQESFNTAIQMNKALSEIEIDEMVENYRK